MGKRTLCSRSVSKYEPKPKKLLLSLELSRSVDLIEFRFLVPRFATLPFPLPLHFRIRCARHSHQMPKIHCPAEFPMRNDGVARVISD